MSSFVSGKFEGYTCPRCIAASCGGVQLNSLYFITCFKGLGIDIEGRKSVQGPSFLYLFLYFNPFKIGLQLSSPLFTAMPIVVDHGDDEDDEDDVSVF